MRPRRRTVSLTTSSPSATSTRRGRRRRSTSWGSERDEDDDHSAGSAPVANNVSDQGDGGEHVHNTTTSNARPRSVASMSSSATYDDQSNYDAAAAVKGRVATTIMDDNDSIVSVASSACSLQRPPSTRRIHHTTTAAAITTTTPLLVKQHPSPLPSSPWHTFFSSPHTTILNRLRQQRNSPPSAINNNNHHCRTTPNRNNNNNNNKHHLSEHSEDTDSYDVNHHELYDDEDDDYEDGFGTADDDDHDKEDVDSMHESDTNHGTDDCTTGDELPQQRPRQLSRRTNNNGSSSRRETITTTKVSRSTGGRGKLFSPTNNLRDNHKDGLHQRRPRNNSDVSSSIILQLPHATSSPYRLVNDNPLQPQQYRGRLIHPALITSKQRQSSSASHQQHLNRKHRSTWWSKNNSTTCCQGRNNVLQISLVLVAIVYLCLVAHMYHRASYEQQHQQDQDAVWVWQYQLEKRRLARSYMDQKQFKVMEQVQNQQNQRAQQRQQYTQPTQFASTTKQLQFQPHTILRTTHHNWLDYPEQRSNPQGDVSLLATMEDLCGFYAQNASLAVPTMYSRRDALGQAATIEVEDPTSSPSSTPRVLISGILNPLGYHLALTLKERCKVPHLIGIDYMFPNTVSNRLHQLHQLQTLTTQLEGILDKPVLYANMGLEPAKSGINRDDDAHYLPSGQLDLVKTFRPTHIVHLASYAPEVYKSEQLPTTATSTTTTMATTQGFDHPSMYGWKASVSAMEHILSSIAATEPQSTHRPHLVYLSSRPSNDDDDTTKHHQADNSKFDRLHRAGREVDEILADIYHAQHQVFSVAVRIPDAIFGPWGHVQSPTFQMFDSVVRDRINNNTTATTTSSTLPSDELTSLDVVYVGDVIEGLVAAMQFRSPNSSPVAFDFAPVATVSVAEWRTMAAALLRGSDADVGSGPTPTTPSPHPATDSTRQYLQWFPSTSLREGMIRTLAWHLDQQQPYGTPILQASNVSSSSVMSLTGAALVQQHSLSTCSPDDLVCHAGSSFLPCASECSIKTQCTPSVFDSMVSLMHEVLEGCDVVLYTQALDIKDELELETEYMDEGNPLICTIAFVNFESHFVQTVVKKVPDPELVKLGVTPRHEDGGTPEGIHKLKRDKLNGRLLYLGWLLVWPDEIPHRLSHADSNLLKLSPGRLFPPEVKYGVFIEQSFGASPRIDDVYFLMHSMTRPAVPTQIAKSKTVPKTKFRLPPEPPKRAVLLLSELRRQESSKSHRVYSDSKLSIRQASRYMRYELGEDPIGKEPLGIKQQREFYERATTFLNSNAMRSPMEPLYKLELKQLARTRWVVHDLQLEEGRQLRCDWYREHLGWNSPLDQLSLAFVMAQRELHRRLAHSEIDDRVKMSIADQVELKKLLTDVLEWHPLQTEVNRHYSPFTDIVEEVRMDSVLETDDTDEEGIADSAKPEFLFARIISDRYLSMARKSWNTRNH